MSSYLSLYQPYRLTHSSHVFLPLPLPALPSTISCWHSLPSHRHISSSHVQTYHVQTYHMSKSIMSYNLKHWSKIHTTQQLIRCHFILQRNTTHSSHHHSFCSLETLYILHRHCSCLTTILHHTLNTTYVTLAHKTYTHTHTLVKN